MPIARISLTVLSQDCHPIPEGKNVKKADLYAKLTRMITDQESTYKTLGIHALEVLEEQHPELFDEVDAQTSKLFKEALSSLPPKERVVEKVLSEKEKRRMTMDEIRDHEFEQKFNKLLQGRSLAHTLMARSIAYTLASEVI